MSKAGDVYKNPVTDERGVARIGTEETGGELLVVDLYIRPGGAVMGEHLHPAIEERFTVLRGRVGFRLAGRESIAEPGIMLIAPARVPHDWWNAGPEEALVRVEIRPAARFEAFLKNAFGLAQDGKVNRRGMPNLLQLAIFAREFDDVIQFTHPPRAMQRLLFGLLAPLARRCHNSIRVRAVKNFSTEPRRSKLARVLHLRRKKGEQNTFDRCPPD